MTTRASHSREKKAAQLHTQPHIQHTHTHALEHSFLRWHACVDPHSFAKQNIHTCTHKRTNTNTHRRGQSTQANTHRARDKPTFHRMYYTYGARARTHTHKQCHTLTESARVCVRAPSRERVALRPSAHGVRFTRARRPFQIRQNRRTVRTHSTPRHFAPRIRPTQRAPTTAFILTEARCRTTLHARTDCTAHKENGFSQYTV